MKQSLFIISISIALLCGCASLKHPLKNESCWTKPSNGLSAKLVVTHETSFGTKVLHPKILLRNDSKNPISFLKCIYNAGTFDVRTSEGKKVQPHSASRSGPLGAEVAVIKPFETIEFDAYDCGYGISKNVNTYAFHTASFQTRLLPGKYTIDYSLEMNKDSIKNMLKLYDWITEKPDVLWHGQLVIRNTELILN